MNKILLKNFKRVISFLLLFSLTFSLYACQIEDIADIAIEGILSITDELGENKEGNTEDKNEADPTPVDGIIKIHFLDVGQGDSILITSSEGVILVDSSLKNSSVTKSICEYIQNLGIKEIDSIQNAVLSMSARQPHYVLDMIVLMNLWRLIIIVPLKPYIQRMQNVRWRK